MKAMILFDMLTVRKYLLQQAVMGIVLGAVVCLVMENLYFVIPLLTMLVAYTISFSLMALDERNGWEQFRLALPVTRGNVVVGRYVSCALFSLVGILIGLAITGGLMLAAHIAPNVGALGSLLASFSWRSIVLVGAVGVGLTLVMFSIVLPFVMRLGMTKAARIVVVAFVLVIFGGVSISGHSGAPAFIQDFGLWLQAPSGAWLLAAAIVAACLALYALSAAVSVRLYRHREV